MLRIWKQPEIFFTYFHAVSSEGYHNNTTDFRSYFLTFEDGARLEIMNKPGMNDSQKTLASTGDGYYESFILEPEGN